MRRPARLVLGVLAASSLVLTPALAGTAAAAPGKGSGKPAAAGKPSAKPAPATSASAQPTARPAKPAKPGKLPAKKKVVVVGIVTATPTVVTQGSATATVVTIKVQGGDKEYRGTTVNVTVPSSAVVKRNHGKAARYELKKGDKVTVHARRDAAGRLTATYVAASGRPATVQPAPASTSTATTTATTRP